MFHFIVRFEPRPGKVAAFREELLRVIATTRTEAGCVSIRAFETVREPAGFAIHSAWVDEGAFDTHAGLPHTVHFVQAAEALLTHAIEGLRTREIGGASVSPGLPAE